MPDRPNPHGASNGEVVAATRAWLEKAVIGLDLCPFARAVYVKDQIRYSVSEAATPEALLADLRGELQLLAAADPAAVETTLLIHPRVLAEFLDYNDFLDAADLALADLGLVDDIQIASFHPRYQFAGTGPDDVENCTNRSPYPMLHLLREASVERAVASVPDPAQIFGKNIATLRRLGQEGWDRLGLAAPTSLSPSSSPPSSVPAPPDRRADADP
jgi:hypothetical protein